MMNGMEISSYSLHTKYTYQAIEGIPEQEVLIALLDLYNELFEDAKLDFFKKRIETKEDLVITLCYSNDVLIGFKLGYRYDETTLYSWVGGVLPQHRLRGIGKQLMQLQHNYVLKKGYKKVRTKSMNRFKSMMILNLKNGFDIVEIYTNNSQQTKIIFEKNLTLL